MGVLAASCLLALGLASATSAKWVPRNLRGFLRPQIKEVSAWYEMFEPENKDRVYVGCDLRDGSYIAGVVAWFSTDTDDIADRDVVLGSPLTRRLNGKTSDLDGVHRVIVSAREIAAMYVTYLSPEEGD